MLFLPDQHLGRNTAVLKMGLSLDDCVVWDPHRPNGGLTVEELRDAKMILWKGHCSVHGRFSAEVVDELRADASPASRSWCTPSARTRSCSRPTSSARPSSSSRRSRRRRPARPGRSAPSSTWSSGWPHAHPDKKITFLDKTVCYCSTMNRIDLPHLVWALESLVDGHGRQPDRGRPRDRAVGARSPWSGCSRCPAAPPRRPDRGVRHPASLPRVRLGARLRASVRRVDCRAARRRARRPDERCAGR